MENNLKIFENSEFGSVRTIVDGDKVLFCGSDVARALGYSRTNEAIAYHYKGTEKRRTPTNGGEQEMLFIREGDIYRLIAHSKLPSAEQFEHWVFDEVLPTIHKTGGYVANEDLLIDVYLKNADEQTKLLFRSTLATIRKMNEQLELAQPKVEYFNALVDRNLLTSFRDTAKELGIKEKEFINFLIENKFIYRDQKKRLRPYTAKNDGYFQLKEYVDEKNGFAGCHTLITPKGRETFRLLVNAG